MLVKVKVCEQRAFKNQTNKDSDWKGGVYLSVKSRWRYTNAQIELNIDPEDKVRMTIEPVLG